MWQVTAAAIGAMAFCAVVFVAWGLFGRADDTRPRCARCGADARPVAWSEPPVCACGRRLDRAGAVRSSGRARRPRLLMLGVGAGILAIAILLIAGALERRRLAWPDLLPLAFVTLNADAGRAWAAESIARRHAAGRLDDATLLSMRDRRAGATGAIATRITLLRAVRFAEWMTVDGQGVRPFTAEELDIIRLQGSIGLVVEAADGSDPTSSGIPPMQIRGIDRPFFARIERVLVDGEPVRFALEREAPHLPPHVSPPPGARVFCVPVRLRIVDEAQGSARGHRTVLVELRVVLSRAWEAAATDPLIDSDADPSVWGIDGRSMRVRIEATIEDDTDEEAP